jgi:hypothetical protein
VALTDEAGIDHRVWALRAPDDVAAIIDSLAPARAVIADGHHRYARALAHSEHLAAGRGGGALGDRIRSAAPWRRTLMYLVDATAHGPRPMPIHRLVRRMPVDALDRLRPDFRLDAAPADPRALLRALDGGGEPVLALCLHGGRALLLRARDPAALDGNMPPERSPRWRALPTALLDHAVLPALGIDEEPELHSDLPAALAEVQASAGAGLFVLPPTDTATVLALAEAREPMPPKTTSFQPKPRTGLIMRDVLG